LPHFTLQITPQGCLLNALVGVSEARKAALIASSSVPPAAVPIRALVDTGASGTCVDPSVLETLALTATGKVSVNTPSTGTQPHEADQYDISLVVPGADPTHLPLSIGNLPVICAELLLPQGFHALIGRDVLSRCVFVYNSLVGLYTVCY